MRRVVGFLFLFCLAPLLAGAGAPVRREAPEWLLREDSWFAFQMQGSHVGWMHMVRVPEVGEERTTVTTLQEVFMRINRYGEEMEVFSSQVSEETREGGPLSIQVTTAMSREKTVTRGTFQGDRLLLKMETPGGTARTELAWPPEGVLALGADMRVLRETGLEPGRSVTYTTYSPDLGSIIRETVEVEARRPGGLLVLRTTQEELPGQHTRTLVEPETWRIQEIEIQSLGMRFVRTSREKAKDLSEDLPDIGFDTLVPVDRRIEAPERVGRAVYRLEAEEGILEGLDLEQGQRQRVLGPAEGGGVRLEVRRTGPHAGEAEEAEPRYLASSSWLQTDSAALRKALAEALGPDKEGERDTGEVARRLALWVWKAVDERALDVGFATAAEVARDRRGDCTEHAVLLAALLRAAGIPSRVRAGLLYLPDGGDGNPAFGFHLWTQAWIGGWMDLDATLGGGEADALHLGLATSDLNDPGGVGPLAVMAPLLGSLKLELLEVAGEPQPRASRPGGM